MKKRSISILLSALILAGCGSACGNAADQPPEMELQTSQMQNICELATMDCYYHNVAKYFHGRRKLFVDDQGQKVLDRIQRRRKLGLMHQRFL